MYQSKKILIILIIFCSLCRINAQGIGIGDWRDHLPYNNCISVIQVKSRIYCATPYSLFYFDKSDNSIGRLNKINGLSDIDVTTINYDAESDFLIVAYKNANIDLVDVDNNVIINIPDIKIKPIIGEKKINKILFLNKKAYLSCGFGIVVLDLVKKEIKETYIIGENGTTIEVFDLITDGTSFYAATGSGIYKALMNEPNLSNYASWHKQTNINSPNAKFNAIIYYNNKIIVNKFNSQYNHDTMYVNIGDNWNYYDSLHFNTITKSNFKTYNNNLYCMGIWGVYIYNKGDTIINIINNTDAKDLIYDSDDQQYWIADEYFGLIKVKNNNFEFIKPNGPFSTHAISMAIKDGNLWVAPGGYELSSWTSAYNSEGIFTFINDKWSLINKNVAPPLDTIWDFITVAIDPNDSKRVYMGSWGRGLLEFYDSKLVTIYNEKNSPLRPPPSYGSYYWIGVGGLCFDDDHNLWISNMSLGSGEGLIVRKANGEWKKFNLGFELNAATNTRLMIDKSNQKWLMLSRGGGIAVFNDNNTIDNTTDDKPVKILGTEVGNGKLPSSNVICFATDLDGKVWVGTNDGLSVFYSPENIFTNQNYDSQQILVDQDGHIRPLLEGEFITSIVIDGANRKWIGTQNSGVYLMSADGTEEIYKFNTNNSPLISNTINCITIDGITGEVFFGTDKGIVSFKGTSTDGTENFDNIFAYPNPVREDYEGVIAIKGLVTNAIVKITDISGNLIYETIAEGGQAVWNGKNFDGEKAQTGVYLVFCTNDDGSKSEVTKILIIN